MKMFFESISNVLLVSLCKSKTENQHGLCNLDFLGSSGAGAGGERQPATWVLSFLTL